MRKSTICICENKDADQLCSNCTADQRLCFRNTDITIPLLDKSNISSFLPVSVTVLDLGETQIVDFSLTGSFINVFSIRAAKVVSMISIYYV